MYRSIDLINGKISIELEIKRLKDNIKAYKEKIASNVSALNSGKLQPNDIKHLKDEIKLYQQRLETAKIKLEEVEKDYTKITRLMKEKPRQPYGPSRRNNYCNEMASLKNRKVIAVSESQHPFL